MLREDGRMPSTYVEGLPQPGRALVMGVLNVTPDSFSDGGAWLEPDQAVARAGQMIAEGADLIDIGGESTRPGAEQVPAAEQLARVLPVVRTLTAALPDVPLSIDTMSAEVARQAVEHGVRLVNDVSGGMADPAMLPAVAELGVPYVCMHWRGHSRTMNEQAVYAEVVDDVLRELGVRVDAAVEAGIDPARIAIDPGLGFAKNAEHDWALLGSIDRLTAFGFPVLVGGSRKRFLGHALAGLPGADGPPPADERDMAGVALAAIAAREGAWCIRSHAVRPTLEAVTVAAHVGT